MLRPSIGPNEPSPDDRGPCENCDKPDQSVRRIAGRMRFTCSTECCLALERKYELSEPQSPPSPGARCAPPDPAEIGRRCAARFFQDRKAKAEVHLSQPELADLLTVVIRLAQEGA